MAEVRIPSAGVSVEDLTGDVDMAGGEAFEVVEVVETATENVLGDERGQEEVEPEEGKAPLRVTFIEQAFHILLMSYD